MATVAVPHESRDITKAHVYLQLMRVLDCVLGLLYGLLLIRAGLELLGANEHSQFKRILDRISDPVMTPFFDLFSSLPHSLGTTMVVYAVAMIVILMAYGAIRGLLRLTLLRYANSDM